MRDRGRPQPFCHIVRSSPLSATDRANSSTIKEVVLRARLESRLVLFFDVIPARTGPGDCRLGTELGPQSLLAEMGRFKGASIDVVSDRPVFSLFRLDIGCGIRPTLVGVTLSRMRTGSWRTRSCTRLTFPRVVWKH
jgi:hypothetical protein